MRVALAPINPTVGDLVGNADLVIEAYRRSRDAGADLVAFPELVVSGYPPRDLLWQEGFLEANAREVRRIAQSCLGVTAIVGAPRRDESTGAIHNSLFALQQGAVLASYDKRLLPTYDVFDEGRYFTPGARAVVLNISGWKVGLAICEDLWRGDDAGFLSRYLDRPDPVTELVRLGAEIIVCPSATPFVLGKSRTQRDILRRHVERHGVPLLSINQLGANDDLIFDGHTAIVAPPPPRRGQTGSVLVAAGALFCGDMLIHDFDRPAAPTPEGLDPAPQEMAEALLWDALTLGVRDYVRKTGFQRVVLGLSGGIDSAVTACIAAAALEPANVLGVAMPSRHSSAGSVRDAEQLAHAIGSPFTIKSIESLHASAEHELTPLFAELGAESATGHTEENVQSRLRGLLLMAIANKTGALLLTTGNKSEIAVGYCTLYGDMNGGLAVLSDVSKTLVYRLGRWINEHSHLAGFAVPPIPRATLEKPPSAELHPGQTDQDTLPPYDLLDTIIERFIERRQSPGRIARESGVPRQLVNRLADMIERSEFKRKQAAPGLKVTGVAFGAGRRHPIAQGWRDDAD